MPSNFEATVSIEEYTEDDDYGPDDFSFVVGPDGELKSFSVPEHLMSEAPEEIKMILSLFGIDDIHDLDNRTLH
jgi:hypothetical protein